MTDPAASPHIEIPSRAPSATPTDDTVMPFEVAALDLRGRVVRLGPVVDQILDAARLSAAGRQAPGRGGGAHRHARLGAEDRRPLHPADADRRPGAHAGGGLHRARQGARLRALRQGSRRGGDRRRQGRRRRAARQGPSRHDHRPGSGHEPLPGPGRARRRLAGRRRARIFPSAPSRSRRGCGSRSPRNCAPGRAAPAIAGAPAAFCCNSCRRRRSARASPISIPAMRRKAPCRTRVAEDDAWVEGRALVATVEDVELIDPALSSERLVYRLFHEPGVRVFRGSELRAECSCSRESVEAMLQELLAGRPRPHGRERQDFRHLRILQRELCVRAGETCGAEADQLIVRSA